MLYYTQTSKYFTGISCEIKDKMVHNCEVEQKCYFLRSEKFGVCLDSAPNMQTIGLS